MISNSIFRDFASAEIVKDLRSVESEFHVAERRADVSIETVLKYDDALIAFQFDLENSCPFAPGANLGTVSSYQSIMREKMREFLARIEDESSRIKETYLLN